MDQETQDALTSRVSEDHEQAVATINVLCRLSYDIAHANGFYYGVRDDRAKSAALLKLTEETLEVLKADRVEGIAARDAAVGDELADVIITALSLARDRGYNIGYLVMDKMRRNITRGWRHGK